MTHLSYEDTLEPNLVTWSWLDQYREENRSSQKIKKRYLKVKPILTKCCPFPGFMGKTTLPSNGTSSPSGTGWIYGTSCFRVPASRSL